MGQPRWTVPTAIRFHDVIVTRREPASRGDRANVVESGEWAAKTSLIQPLAALARATDSRQGWSDSRNPWREASTKCVGAGWQMFSVRPPGVSFRCAALHPLACAVEGVVVPVGARPTPKGVVPSGSSRSRSGGNKRSRAFDVNGRLAARQVILHAAENDTLPVCPVRGKPAALRCAAHREGKPATLRCAAHRGLGPPWLLVSGAP